MTTAPDLKTAPLAGPFTTQQAHLYGISPKVLRGPRFRRIIRGVYLDAAVPVTLGLRLRACLLVLPADCIVSHLTAARLHGFDPPRADRLELSTNSGAVTKYRELRVHRRRGRLTPYSVANLPCTGPDRTFVDCATQLSLIELVQFGDHLLHTRATSLAVLLAYCHARHLDGVRRARRAAALVRPGVESPRETVVRLLLVFARLPCPQTNTWILDTDGRRVARVDMLYPDFKVIVEYDGRQHERDPKQRQRDRERREQLEALGYRLIVITDVDLRTAEAIPWRVYEALKSRGYRGPVPRTSVMWQRWFATA